MFTDRPTELIKEALRGLIADRFAEEKPGLLPFEKHGEEEIILPLAMMLNWTDTMDLVGIDPSYMRDSETKQNLIVMLKKHIRKHRAQAVGLICPAWTAPVSIKQETMPTEEEVRQIVREARQGKPDRLSDDPDAQECVILWIASQFAVSTSQARVTRHPDKPPSLGEWLEMPRAVEDRFLPHLQQAVIAVA